MSEFALIPHSDSATLSSAAQQFLESRGIHYVIPRIPRGFPPFTAEQAVRVAQECFPVGESPEVREVALVAIDGRSGPLLPHGLIVWAVSFLAPKKKAGSGYYVVFVDACAGGLLGTVR